MSSKAIPIENNKKCQSNDPENHAIPIQSPLDTTSMFRQYASYTLPTKLIDDYLPIFIKNLAAGGETNRLDENNKDKILFCKFQLVNKINYLLVGYANGFQVWDITHDIQIKQIVSLRSDHDQVTNMLYLKKPLLKQQESTVIGALESEDSELPEDNVTDFYPMLAIVCQEAPNILKLFSLESDDFVKELTFESSIISIKLNDSYFIIALSTNIHCYSLDNLVHRFTIASSHININNSISLSVEWLAYPCIEEMSYFDSGDNLETSTSIFDIGSITAKKVATNLYFLGGEIHNYFNSAELSEKQKENQLNEDLHESSTSNNKGNILVIDIANQSVISHLNTHHSPIVIIQFDPSGTMLVTAANDGQTIHINKITHDKSKLNSNSQLIYKLERGITHTSIVDVCFSSDIHYLTVTSSRGTSHVYAISPNGGDINSYTHKTIPRTAYEEILKKQNSQQGLVSEVLSNVYKNYKGDAGEAPNTDEDVHVMSSQEESYMTALQREYGKHSSCVSLNALARIRQQVEASPYHVVACCTFNGAFVYCISSSGLLKKYELFPVSLTPLVDIRATPHLVCLAIASYDLCRRLTWEAVAKPSSVAASGSPVNSSKSVLSQVELLTHAQPLIPFWLSPNISVQTYKTSNNSNKLDKHKTFHNNLEAKRIEIKCNGPAPISTGKAPLTASLARAMSSQIDFEFKDCLDFDAEMENEFQVLQSDDSSKKKKA